MPRVELCAEVLAAAERSDPMLPLAAVKAFSARSQHGAQA